MSFTWERNGKQEQSPRTQSQSRWMKWEKKDEEKGEWEIEKMTESPNGIWRTNNNNNINSEI